MVVGLVVVSVMLVVVVLVVVVAVVTAEQTEWVGHELRYDAQNSRTHHSKYKFQDVPNQYNSVNKDYPRKLKASRHM